MVFSSATFLFLFLPLVCFFYWLPDVVAYLKKKTEENKNCRYKNFVLLISSIVFYAWGEPVFVLVMLLSIVANYLFGKQIDKHRNHDKAILICSVIFNLGILFIFKYLCFTLNNIGLFLNKDFSYIKIALPIGISFFTFQAMSYVIDVYKKTTEVQNNPFSLGLYISLFPQLVAGPIVRYETIAKEIDYRTVNKDEIADGIVRFIVGLGKKVLLADNIALIADVAFETSIPEMSVSLAWTGAIAYTLQIYFDFSGYSDMAIGLGKMFGFHFLENFNYPYVASSITEFWRRWHISLSSWFRDYVYFPLGGSRVNSKTRHFFNLLVVWALTGLWHGANWTFILWGLFYFILLIIEKSLGLDKNKSILGHIYTMFFVIIGWVLFRSDSISYAFDYIMVMFGGINPTAIGINFNFNVHTFVALLVGLCCSMPLFPKIQTLLNSWEKHEKLVVVVNTIFIIAVFVVSAIFVASSSYSPFIYFNF